MKKILLIISLIFSSQILILAQSECDTFILNSHLTTICDSSSISLDIHDVIGNEVLVASNQWFIPGYDTLDGNFLIIDSLDQDLVLIFEAIDEKNCLYTGQIQYYHANDFSLEYQDSLGVCLGETLLLDEVFGYSVTDSLTFYLGEELLDSSRTFGFLDTTNLNFSVNNAMGCYKFPLVTGLAISPQAFELNIENHPISCFDRPNLIIHTESEGLQFNWYGNNGFQGFGDSVYVNVPGDYKLVVTDSLGCTKEYVENVGFTFQKPNFSIESSEIICNQTLGYLSIITDSLNTVNITFPDSSIVTNSYVETNQSGWYHISVQSHISGCYSMDSVFLDQLALEDFAISDTTLCYGDILVLPKSYEVADSIHWLGGIELQDSILFDTVGSFQLLVFFDECMDTLSFSLEFTDPIADYDIAGDTLVCYNASGILTVQGDYNHLLWNDTISEDTFQFVNTNPIHLQVFDEYGCSRDTVFSPDFIEPIQITLDSLIEDDLSDSGAIYISHSSNGYNPYSVLWSTGDTTLSVTELSVGNYTVSVSDGFGCTYEEQYYIDKTYVPLVIPNAHWFVLRRGLQDTSLNSFFAFTIKDTLVNVNGTEYYEVYHQNLVFDFNQFLPSPPYYIMHENLYAYIREDLLARKVYAIIVDEQQNCNSTEEQLWYNFASQQGDDLNTSCVFDEEEPVICGEIQYYNYYEETRKFYPPTLIEGFGTIYGLFDKDGYKNTVPGVTRSFVDYCVGTDEECMLDRTLDSYDINNQNHLLKIINKNGQILVESGFNGRFEVFDIMGRSLIERKIFSNQITNIGEIGRNGMVYIFRFLTEDGRIQTLKYSIL